jgi:SAM-dependent methyltransferase
VISAARAAPRSNEASIDEVSGATYDGLADAYDVFVDEGSHYYRVAADALRRLLEERRGQCLDLGCGGGHFTAVAVELGWTVTGIDASEDQLRVARDRLPTVEFVQADGADLPFADGSFDAGFSTFTHTDFDDFAGSVQEARRVLKPNAPFVYVGNHPCFVGPTQELVQTGLPQLHPGYRRAGRWRSADAPGTTPGGWREQLGSFVHLPLADFLNAFAGFTVEHVDELEDGREYPSAIALRLRKP